MLKKHELKSVDKPKGNFGGLSGLDFLKAKSEYKMKDKREYYKSRINDKKLTAGQRSYAINWVDKFGGKQK